MGLLMSLENLYSKKKAGDEVRTHDPHVGNVMLYH